jgi:hypothetical protein
MLKDCELNDLGNGDQGILVGEKHELFPLELEYESTGYTVSVVTYSTRWNCSNGTQIVPNGT